MQPERNRSSKRHRHPLTPADIEASASWIAAQQRSDGEIPWMHDDKGDPWDHVHSAMGLSVAGRFEEAARAYQFLVDTQFPSGGWPAERKGGKITNRTQETHHAAYFATGVWHHYLATEDKDFLDDMWPTVCRATEFVVSLQEKDGTVSWAIGPRGRVWHEPLLTANASIHGGFVCAERISRVLGIDRTDWADARDLLGEALSGDLSLYENRDLPEPPGRYSMDWYYPVLGGAMRGREARTRLQDPAMLDKFLAEGVGIRCVADQPWYTVAETSELVLALHACGLEDRAAQVLSWMHPFRMEGGGYRTGRTHPEGVFWPLEHNAWTTATVLLAADAICGESLTSSFFKNLDPEEEEVMAAASAS